MSSSPKSDSLRRTLAWHEESSGDGSVLEVEGMRAGYGPQTAVFDADLSLRRGEVVALMGHNGAGKTTTVKSIFGLGKPRGGTITYEGRDIGGWRPRDSVSSGMSFTPSEEYVFADLSV